MLWNILFGISSALAEASEGGNGDQVAQAPNMFASIISLLLPWVLMIAIFYFILIRPQRKKDKAVKAMLANLKKDDRICTIGGIYGTVVNIKDDRVELSVGKNNMSMWVARWAIRSVEEIAIENDSEALN